MTPRQRQTLDFIAAFIKQHGHSPSYREIADGTGISATSAALRTVGQLHAQGHIIVRPGKHRSIELPGQRGAEEPVHSTVANEVKPEPVFIAGRFFVRDALEAYAAGLVDDGELARDALAKLDRHGGRG